METLTFRTENENTKQQQDEDNDVLNRNGERRRA